eukprot:jgi/Tetstr1/439136/TSEL_027588.t1
MGAPISHYPEWMTGALGRRREAHVTLLERIAAFGTSGYGCHHGTMRLLVVCAVRQTGFLSRMMPPSELGPFLEAVDAANISAAFSLLGLDACDQSTPRMKAAIVQMSLPADFGGMNLALLQSEAPAAFYSAQSVVLPKLVREYGPALGPLFEAVRAEGVHQYYPFVVEDRGRLGKSALTVVYIFVVLLVVRNFPGGP